MQMQPMMAAYYSNNVTTDHIQQVLSSHLCHFLFHFWLAYYALSTDFVLYSIAPDEWIV